MTNSTIAAIGAAFHDAGFAPTPDRNYDDSSVRRPQTQFYLESVDWSDPGHAERACQTSERLPTG